VSEERVVRLERRARERVIKRKWKGLGPARRDEDCRESDRSTKAERAEEMRKGTRNENSDSVHGILAFILGSEKGTGLLGVYTHHCAVSWGTLGTRIMTCID
jgi:hypothetical protein